MSSIDLDRIVREAVTAGNAAWEYDITSQKKEIAEYAVRAALIAAAEECKNSLGRADCCVKFGRQLAKQLRAAAGGGE